jgi:type IV pilus assembly protein PilW
MSDMRNNNRITRRARVRGVSLIELLVAVTIGGLLIFGATKVYVDSRATYEVNETAARLQETARYAMSVIEPDIRMSNYWGLVKGAGIVVNQAAPGAASAGAPTRCGNNYGRDLIRNVEGSNNGYALDCAAYNAKPVIGSDTLTIRRAAVAPSVGAATNRLRICSTRVMAELVTDSSACTGAPAGQINDLIVNAYYVDQDSVQRAGLPALRRWGLIAGPDFTDDEIIPGVEDMQVQFGVDPTGVNGVAQRYINPEALGANEQIVAVRVWLLIRAENPEVGFVDNRTYEYADRSIATGTTANLNTAGTEGFAYKPADGFRRVLVSRTIQIRNALGT